jgi:hypothetical protein
MSPNKVKNKAEREEWAIGYNHLYTFLNDALWFVEKD